MAGATAHCPRGCISAYIAQMLLLLAFQARLLALFGFESTRSPDASSTPGRRADCAVC
jgi:hypothetical protein